MNKGTFPDFLAGAIVPMVTPFQENGDLDEEGMRVFSDWLCQTRATALFPMGGSGEFRRLTLAERRCIIDLVGECARGKKAVIPGVGADTLEDTIALARYAQEQKADGITVVVPTNIPAAEDDIFAYFAAIDAAVEIPIIIYDFIGKGDHAITPALMSRLAQLHHIAGIKYRSEDIRDTMLMAQASAGRVAILAGIEMYYLPTLAVGGVGVVGGGCNIYPNLIDEVRQLFHEGKHEAALAAQLEIEEAIAMLIGPWPLTAKVALAALGLPILPVTRGAAGTIPAEQSEKMAQYFRRLDSKYNGG